MPPSAAPYAGVSSTKSHFSRPPAPRPDLRKLSRSGRRLFGRFGLLQRQRLGAGPGMLGDVEEDALGAVELDLEAADPGAVLVHVMFAAQPFELLGGLVDILDEDPEMVQAGVVQTFAELVGLKPQ